MLNMLKLAAVGLAMSSTAAFAAAPAQVTQMIAAGCCALGACCGMGCC
ncbi:MAG: hypothetical protein Q27BB25_01155 [Blastomonas sp. CACIA14H2]|nr:MAG: hypothetical protein Q27BB25_01155 [Blastomonas sp. CACIA14H2]